MKQLWATLSIGCNEIWAMPDYKTAVNTAWGMNLDTDTRIFLRDAKDREAFPFTHVAPVLWDGSEEEWKENIEQQGGAEKMKEKSLRFLEKQKDLRIALYRHMAKKEEVQS